MLSTIKTLVKTLQTPLFTVVKSDETEKKDFEIRSYEAAKWVSTNVKKISHKEGSSVGFRRLFKYIQGENETKTGVDMTAPVTVKVDPGDGPNCENTFTVSFYIPKEHQENPPKPTDKEVYIEERPAMTVYSRTFGGFPSDAEWIEQSRTLMDLIGDEAKFEPNYFFTASYNSPLRLTGRTNDVWLVKKN